MFLDFDGTMAPIVDNPDAARPLAGAVEVLGRLAAKWGVVAVVSGRPAAFLAEHLGGAGSARFLGLYGLERVGEHPGEVVPLPEAAGWAAVVEEAARAAESALPAGAAVERKGLTVTLHYRAVAEQAQDVQETGRQLAARFGLRAHPGKMSAELRPPVDVDKGTVVRELADGLTAVVFAGDDTGDLPAFAALGALRERGVTTLAVAADGPETQLAVVQAADISVPGPDGVIALLRRLAEG